MQTQRQGHQETFTMLRFITVTLFFVSHVTAKSARDTKTTCEVSTWSSWGQCPRSPPCDPRVQQTASYALDEGTEDMGRVVMAMSKAEKEREWREEEECRAAGTCPQLALTPSSSRQNCLDGFAGRYPCKNIDMLSFLDFEALGNPTAIRQHGQDVWGWTDPATNDEYAIMGMYGGTSFVRVTDAQHPAVLGFLPTRTLPSSWHDVKVVNDHAFIVSEAWAHGMQVFDMTRLRNMTSYSILTSDATYLEVGQAHNIVMNQESQTVFIVGARFGRHEHLCKGGLHMVDVSIPKQPRFAGCYAEDGYTHDAQCVIYRGPDRKYQGREICFNYNENSLTIVDITNRSSPVMVSKRGYENYAYSHQGWITEDHTVLLLDDELDELIRFIGDGRTRTHIWDVTSLEDPVLKNTYISTQTSSDHNQYVKGAYTYQSNYASGLRILHIDQDKHELSEVAHFDTLPSSTKVGFKGSWSNYPYFQSGNIVLGSIDYGLFMVRPDYDAMARQVDLSPVTSQQSRTRTVISATKPETCPSLEQTRACATTNC